MDDHEATSDWVMAAVARHGPALARYAASITGSEDAASDVVQDTFLRLCEQSPQRLDGCLAEWLFTVCRNRAIDVRRKLQRMTPTSDDELARQPGAELDPAEAAVRDEAADLVRHWVALLPSQQQEVVRLKFQAGLSYMEISRVTGLSVGNVGFLLHSAMKTLRLRAARST
ncbi:MAG: sigma-70 family RNA polymerase sigma factor [Verrucomicrobiales bacterium]|nr:sigma-70 family RNA polymerase sigma factor [Verrucomicrobiales bacterium]